MTDVKDILSKSQTVSDQSLTADSPPKSPKTSSSESRSKKKNKHAKARKDDAPIYIEKYAPILFTPLKSPNITEIRTHEWTPKSPLISASGESLKQSITIIPSKGGRAFSTWAYPLCNTAFSCWVDKGMEGNDVFLSLREGSRGLGIKDSSFNSHWANLVSEELHCLRDTGIKWRHCYQRKLDHETEETNKTKQNSVHLHETVDSFSIFSNVQYTKMEGRLQGTPYTSKTCRITLNEKLADNLRNGHSIPVKKI